MPQIAPARLVRYAGDTDLTRLVTPPYDVIDEAGRRQLEAASPHNFVRLILPREQPGDDATARYTRARAQLDGWMQEGVLRKDAEPSILAVEQAFVDPQTGERRVRRGVQALLKLSEFSEGQVLPHERTLSGPKADRLALLDAVGAHLSPVFVLYPDEQNEVLAALEGVFARPADQEADAAGAHHRAWRITDAATISRVQELLARRTGYIADGHHRYETALRYRQLARERGLAVEGTARDYIPAFFCSMSDPGLVVLPTHRLVHSMAVDFDQLGARLGQLFQLEPQVEDVRDEAGQRRAIARLRAGGERTVAMVGRGGQCLFFRMREADVPTLPKTPALRSLDVVLLHAIVLEHLLGMSKQSQERQEHLAYVKDAQDAMRRTLSGEAQAAFLLAPTPVAKVRAVAEAGEVMPQKSTFFYPKIIDGLGVQLLDGEPVAR